jgi:hypothetical protein
MLRPCGAGAFRSETPSLPFTKERTMQLEIARQERYSRVELLPTP